MWKPNFLVGEAWHDLPSRQLRRRDWVKILSLAASASGSALKDSSSNEVDSWTAPHRMLMMMGRSHLRTSSMPGRQLEMFERTCCSQCAGMAATRQTALPWWLRGILWPVMLGRCACAFGMALKSMLSSHLV